MSAIDTGFIVERAKKVLKDPKGVWTEVAAEQSSIQDIYSRYLIPMAAIPVVCQYLKMVSLGMTMPIIGTYRWGIFEGMIYSILVYASSLVGVYVGGMVIEFLAPKFDSSVTRTDGVKLLAYAGTPYFVSGVFYLIPGLGIPLLLVASLYAFYVMYQGFTALCGAPANKQIPFLVTYIILTGIVMFFVNIVVGVFGPEMPVPKLDSIQLPGGRSVDLEEFQKSMEHLKNALPKE